MRKFYWWEENTKDKKTITKPDSLNSPDVESSPKYEKIKNEKEDLEKKAKDHKEKQKKIIDNVLKKTEEENFSKKKTKKSSNQ